MKRYIIGIVIFGFMPLMYAFIYYFGDVWEYLSAEEPEDILLWRDYPYGMMQYAFIILAGQVHLFSLMFAWNLQVAWKSRGAKKIE